jgi:hypothetical protein
MPWAPSTFSRLHPQFFLSHSSIHTSSRATGDCSRAGNDGLKIRDEEGFFIGCLENLALIYTRLYAPF